MTEELQVPQLISAYDMVKDCAPEELPAADRYHEAYELIFKHDIDAEDAFGMVGFTPAEIAHAKKALKDSVESRDASREDQAVKEMAERISKRPPLTGNDADAIKKVQGALMNAWAKREAEETLARQDALEAEDGGDSWATTVDIDDIFDKLDADPDDLPTLLPRKDGKCLIYAGKLNVVYGESESAKSWLCLMATLETLRNGGKVLYLDFEDSASGIVGRLRTLGGTREEIKRGFVYRQPVSPPTPGTPGGEEMKRLVAERFDLVVIDAFTPASSAFGLKGREEDDVATFHRLLTHPFSRTGSTVMVIDHVPKENGAEHFAIGSQQKRAIVSGVQLWLQVKKPFGQGRAGHANIWVAKDRPGHVRAIAVSDRNGGKLELVGEFHLGIDANMARTSVTQPYGRIEVPTVPSKAELKEKDKERTEAQTADAIATVKVKVAELLLGNPGVSRRVVQKAPDFDCSEATKTKALGELIEGGYVEVYRESGTSYDKLRLVKVYNAE